MDSVKKVLKSFAMTNQLMEYDLDKIERDFGINLGRMHQGVIGQDASYYPQIEQAIRDEASAMAPHYEVFYSLEKMVRQLVSGTLSATDINWWESARVPEFIKQNAVKTQGKEVDAGVTPRSDDLIDFCTFGELGEIIKVNWDVFGSIFSSQKAVERVIANLNTLRGPIAHCSKIADDEIVRLRLTVRDWFRLME